MPCSNGRARLSRVGRSSYVLLPLTFASIRGQPIHIFALFLFLFALNSHADDEKKAEKKKEPPRVIVCIPLAAVPGATNKIKIRGLNLTNATEIHFADATNISAKIKSRGKADVPKDQDAKKSGDTQLEIELTFPENTPPGTNNFTIISPDGESALHSLILIPSGSLMSEKEPNGSFRQAQPIQFGKTIQGVIGEAKDVDVFRFDGKTGAEIVAEVFASRYGSPLDSILTLYDGKAHIIATSDDTDTSTDALLRAKLPSDGLYFLSLIDAHDHGGPASVYQLIVRFK